MISRSLCSQSEDSCEIRTRFYEIRMKFHAKMSEIVINDVIICHSPTKKMNDILIKMEVPMRIEDIKIEYLHEPIGLDEKTPGFSWKIESNINHTIQTSYRIQVEMEAKVVWDSGVVNSDKSICVLYEGERLHPQKEYRVTVWVSDNHGNTAMADTKFETGLMDETNFPGKWITHSLNAEDTRIPIFEKKFVANGNIEKARVYVTACGIYEISLNESKIGDQYFAPGWTAYQKRVLYQTYDITSQIKKENKVSVAVGNGWYKGIIGFAYRPNFYGDRVALKAAVWVKYSDHEEWVTTDESWETVTAEILESEIYNGEILDFTKERVSHGKAVEFNPVGKIGKIQSQAVEQVRITERILPKKKFMTPKGELVIDFGQNLTGVVEVKLPELTGNELVIRHAEALDQNGNFYTENLRRAKATDIIRYGKKDIGRVVMPKFTFHGFRYIAVEGVDENVDKNCFIACVIHTDMKKTGEFICNEPLVNQLQNNIYWSTRDNFLDIPTDCPQRDERLGWTGDAQIFCETAAYNMDVAAFFRKWLADAELEQTDEYGPAHVVPNVLGNIEAGAGWCDSITIIPWVLYQVYGDKRFLSNQYRGMKRYLEYIMKHCQPNGLWQTGLQYGDWLSLDREPGNNSGITDQYFTANAYYLKSIEIVRDTAKILGYLEDFKKYEILYIKTKNAFQKEYITETGRIVSETQTGCILPLQFHLAQKEHEKVILNTLVNNIYNHKMHLTTGFMGTPFLCPVLSEYGQHELAAKMFLSEDSPSWLYSVKMGATTIWERWDCILPDGSFNTDGMNSLNHYANGSIGAWMYQEIAGIKRLEPGYKKILIAPRLTEGLYEVKASLESVYGMIESSYFCKDGKIVIDVKIPPNTTAEINLPEKDEVIEVGSGNYHYEYATARDLRPLPYSMFSLVKDVVTKEVAQEILKSESPETLQSPIMGVVWEMPLYRLAGLMQGKGEAVLEKIVRKLNKNEEIQ